LNHNLDDLYSILNNLKKINGAFLKKEKDPLTSFLEESIKEMFSHTESKFKKPLNKEKTYPSWEWADDVAEETIYLDDFFFSASYKKPSEKNCKKEYSLPFSKKISEFYAILNLEYARNIDEVKKAWKKICKENHPDLHSNNKAKEKEGEEKLKSATAAYKEIEAFLKLHNKI
jgi:DnaJ-domain-containing protein 1